MDSLALIVVIVHITTLNKKLEQAFQSSLIVPLDFKAYSWTLAAGRGICIIIIAKCAERRRRIYRLSYT